MRKSIIALAFGTLVTVGGALAQQAPRPPDPVMLAAQKAFETLDLASRKAIQRDLIWVAKFEANATGDFGALTYAALRRFETEAKSSVDGILTPDERKALAAAADKARAAVQFSSQTDPVSGMRIGLPGKVLVKRTPNQSGGSRWQDKDEKITLDVSILKPEDDLPAVFEKGTAASIAGRKITYKLLRPDFFVISGETETGKFYRRVEKPASGPLRGFSIGYGKDVAAEVDKLVIAIAASFEAIPDPKAPVAGKPPQPIFGTGVVATPAVERRVTAILVASDRAVTSEAGIRGCKTLSVTNAGAPGSAAQVIRADAATGLAVLGVKLARPLPLVPEIKGETSSALLIQRDGEGAVLASAGDLAKGRITASLQDGGAGAAVLDRSGALIGIVVAEPKTKIRVAGIVPATSYPMLGAAEIARISDITAKAGAATPEKSSGEIAQGASPAILSVLCGS